MYSAYIYDIEYNQRTIKDYEVFAFSKLLKVLLAELYKGTEKEFNIHYLFNILCNKSDTSGPISVI